MARSHNRRGGSRTKARQSPMAAKARKLTAPYNDEQQAFLRMFEDRHVPPAEVLDAIAEALFWGKPDRGAGESRTLPPGWAQNVLFRKDGQIDRRTVCPRCFQARSLLGGCGCGDLPGHGQESLTATLVARRWGCDEEDAQRLIDHLVGQGKPLQVLLDAGNVQRDHGRRRPVSNPAQGKFNQ